MAFENQNTAFREVARRAAKSPLGFFVLVALLIQGVLIAITPRAQGLDFTILLVASFFMLAVVVVLVAMLAFKALKPARAGTSPVRIEPRGSASRFQTDYVPAQRYDAFVSAPMASLKPTQYGAERQNVLKVVQCLRNDCKMGAVFFAGEAIETPEQFEPVAVSVEKDIEAIENSEYFILILNKKVASGSLFEAGYALALGKQCVYFVRSRKNLPFLMQHLAEVIENVEIFEFKGIGDIVRMLKDLDVLHLKVSRLPARSTQDDWSEEES